MILKSFNVEYYPVDGSHVFNTYCDLKKTRNTILYDIQPLITEDEQEKYFPIYITFKKDIDKDYFYLAGYDNALSDELYIYKIETNQNSSEPLAYEIQDEYISTTSSISSILPEENEGKFLVENFVEQIIEYEETRPHLYMYVGGKIDCWISMGPDGYRENSTISISPDTFPNNNQITVTWRVWGNRIMEYGYDFKSESAKLHYSWGDTTYSVSIDTSTHSQTIPAPTEAKMKEQWSVFPEVWIDWEIKGTWNGSVEPPEEDPSEDGEYDEDVLYYGVITGGYFWLDDEEAEAIASGELLVDDLTPYLVPLTYGSGKIQSPTGYECKIYATNKFPSGRVYYRIELLTAPGKGEWGTAFTGYTGYMRKSNITLN